MKKKRLVISLAMLLLLTSQQKPYYLIPNPYSAVLEDCNTILDLTPQVEYIIPKGKIWHIGADQIMNDLDPNVWYRSFTINDKKCNLKKEGTIYNDLRIFTDDKTITFPLKLKEGTRIKLSTLKNSSNQSIKDNFVTVCEKSIK
jgi:hypothetical protein